MRKISEKIKGTQAKQYSTIGYGKSMDMREKGEMNHSKRTIIKVGMLVRFHIFILLLLMQKSCLAFFHPNPKYNENSLHYDPFNHGLLNRKISVKNKRIKNKIRSSMILYMDPKTNDNNGKNEKKNSLFAMNFPRYRISLTRGLDPRRSKDMRNNVFDAFWVGAAKINFMRQYSTQIHFWEECKDDMYNLANFHASKTFWRMLSKVQLDPKCSELILALPNANFSTVCGLIEIWNWFNENASNFGSNNIPLVNVTLVKKSSVPTIIFSKISRNNHDSIFHPLEPLESCNHQIIEARLKSWVRRILVQQSICPFTKSVERSGQGLSDLGVPVGKIYYPPPSRANAATVAVLFADVWDAIFEMMVAGPRGISSILLACPGFDEKFALWAGPIFAMLEACVTVCSGTDRIGIVCFHPKYLIPDGSTWPGFGHMHSLPRLQEWVKEYSNEDLKSRKESANVRLLSEEEVAAGGAFQRRTPHAVINVLRADQLEKAEKKRQTGELYARNIKILVEEVGIEALERDLNDERNYKP